MAKIKADQSAQRNGQDIMGLFSSKLSAKIMAPLCRQLAVSIEAGIPIVRALSLAGEHGASAPARRLLLRMTAAIQEGATLVEAARAESRLLPDFFIEAVAAGELSGHLDLIFRDLADYYEDRHAMTRAIVSSLTYPCMQLAAAWFLGSFALGLASRINPFAAERFSFESYFSDYLRLQMLAVGAFVAAMLFLALLTRAGILLWPWILLKDVLWPLRTISRKFALARFFRSMSLLTAAGVDIRRCIERSAALAMNPIIERDLLLAVPLVAKGNTLTESFSRCRCLSKVGREMLAVGEQTGSLDKTLRKVAEYHFEEARHAMRTFTTIMGVVVMLAVGAVVGYIVIRFYGGLYGNMLNGL